MIVAETPNVRANPRMQRTGRMGAGLRAGGPSGSALWNVGCCRRGPEGLQLMRKSLGNPTAHVTREQVR
jgi:hypothetical protein